MYCGLNIRWLMRKGIPQQDVSQDITNTSVNRSDVITTMIFTRKRDTGDTDHDVALYCQSIVFAWGDKIISKDSILEVHNPTFEDVFQNETCFCPTIARETTMPSSTLKPTMSNIEPECSNCSLALNLCQNSPLCRTLWERYQMACHQNESDGVENSTLCSDECKVAVENFKSHQHGMLYMCCICDDEICTQEGKNVEESYGVSTVKNNVCNMMSNSCKKDNKGS